MNEKFFELSKEKQLRIINAGMEVFGSNDYKHAVTDDIAAKAGISKGLLFYYFHNKKSFYMYLYQYCFDLIKALVLDEEFTEITDFFEMMEYGANKKMALFTEYPFIIDFVMRAFYTTEETISEMISNDMRSSMQENFGLFFKHVDFSKFREDIDPMYIYRMLMWMTDGYLHDQKAGHVTLDLQVLMEDFHKWKELFKRLVYKEEYL